MGNSKSSSYNSVGAQNKSGNDEKYEQGLSNGHNPASNTVFPCLVYKNRQFESLGISMEKKKRLKTITSLRRVEAATHLEMKTIRATQEQRVSQRSMKLGGEHTMGIHQVSPSQTTNEFSTNSSLINPPVEDSRTGGW